MKISIDNIFKIGLSILLFICLFDMPYGYYQLVRYLAMMLFLYFAFKEYQENNQTIAYVYFGLAVLFQPFFKIALGREIWSVIDVVVGIGLLFTIFRDKSKST